MRYRLIWQDEFDDPQLDRSKWNPDIGYTGESNAELEIYTDRRDNLRLESSLLIIEARAETYQGYHYTSARLKTQGLYSCTYGRVEARIKIPFGKGLWPAFWMLGDDVATVGWPECGEIDIMENIGKMPAAVRGTLHGPGYCRDDGIYADYTLAAGRFADDFHIYTLDWEPGRLRWYVDGNEYHTLTPDDVPGRWVFDHPFFILLNVAVGGFWPGYPDETTIMPQLMYVDYVRVYTTDSSSKPPSHEIGFTDKGAIPGAL
jgi:beta-glucanase (GH16 family)